MYVVLCRIVKSLSHIIHMYAYNCFFLYISYHQSPTHTYVGFSINVNRRLREHNRPSNTTLSSRNHAPWRMILSIHGFDNRMEALNFEYELNLPKTCSFNVRCKRMYAIIHSHPSRWGQLKIRIDKDCTNNERDVLIGHSNQ